MKEIITEVLQNRYQIKDIDSFVFCSIPDLLQYMQEHKTRTAEVFAEFQILAKLDGKYKSYTELRYYTTVTI